MQTIGCLHNTISSYASPNSMNGLHERVTCGKIQSALYFNFKHKDKCALNEFGHHLTFKSTCKYKRLNHSQDCRLILGLVKFYKMDPRIFFSTSVSIASDGPEKVSCRVGQWRETGREKSSGEIFITSSFQALIHKLVNFFLFSLSLAAEKHRKTRLRKNCEE